VDSGVVARDDFWKGGRTVPVVSVEAVLRAHAYWDGVNEAAWLAAVLPKVREFLGVHAKHRLSFGDIQRLEYPPLEWLDWLNDDAHPDESPRYLVEVLGLSTWGDVERRYREQGRAPWWWHLADTRIAVRRRFEELTQGLIPRGGTGDAEEP
jgi:hypothetical protein